MLNPDNTNQAHHIRPQLTISKEQSQGSSTSTDLNPLVLATESTTTQSI